MTQPVAVVQSFRWFAGCEIRLCELILRLDPFQYALER